MANDCSDFCRCCGAKLRPGEVQCHECGHLTGQTQAANTAPQTSAFVPREIPVDAQVNNAFKVLTFMIGIYVVVFLLVGVVSTFFAQVEVDYMKIAYGSGWEKYLSEIGIASDTEYINNLILDGGITLISALFALIALLLVSARKHCMVAVMACALGSLVILFTFAFVKTSSIGDIVTCVLQCIIGLLVTRTIFKLKDSFES